MSDETQTWPGSPRGIHAHIERVDRKVDELRTLLQQHVRIERISRGTQVAQVVAIVAALVMSTSALYLAIGNRTALEDQSVRLERALLDLRAEVRARAPQVVVVSDDPGGPR